MRQPKNVLRGKRRLLCGASLALVCALTAASCSSSGSGSSTTSGGDATGTLNVWLGGLLTTSTPGTPYATWVNAEVSRFKTMYPGTDVKITLLPADNDQLAAKVQGAFASHAVPDVMMLYSGAYTTTYEKGLQPLNSMVKATPGFYNSLTGWDLSCSGLDCKGGSGNIVGVPADSTAFVLFYNKKLLAQAGITSPPASWDDLLGQCRTLKAKGITPMAYGDQEGYTTVNFLDENLASYLNPADVQGILNGSAKLTDQKVVDALDAVTKLRTNGCSQTNASTQKQLDAVNLFSSGKAAMVEMYAGLLPNFEKGIGTDNLGVTTIPGSGPLGTKVAANSSDDWVIPSGSKHKTLAWNWIKMAMDEQSSESWVQNVQLPTSNVAAAGKITDPHLRFVADQSSKASLVLLDSVLPNGPALYLYKQLNLAFAGQITAQAAMEATQKQLDASRS